MIELTIGSETLGDHVRHKVLLERRDHEWWVVRIIFHPTFETAMRDGYYPGYANSQTLLDALMRYDLNRPIVPKVYQMPAGWYRSVANALYNYLQSEVYRANPGTD